MLIHKLLPPDQILLDFRPPAGEELATLLQQVAARLQLPEPAEAFAREELQFLHLHLAEGLAILHHLSPQVSEPFLLLALAPEGITLQGRLCRVVAVLLTPLKESGVHFQLLARLTALLQSPQLQSEMLAKGSAQEVWRALRREEESGKENYWVLAVEEIFEELATGPQGLTTPEARRRLAEVGPNLIVKGRRRPLWWRFGAQLVNLFAILLWVATGLAWMAGIRELATAIPLVVVINAIFSFWQEYRAERAVEALARLLPVQTRVLRDGRLQTAPATELVPGDVIILEAGDQIPADARLIEAQDFRVDNSALTGESRPAYKMAEPVEDGQQFLWLEMPNLIFAGTAALSGYARAVVLATGMDTQLGHLATLTQEVKEKPSPLQQEIQLVVKVQAVVACLVGLVFFLAAVLSGRLTWLTGLIFALGMIVAFVPEGLLPTLTLALAMAVQRLARKKAVVKKLSAVEALGAATVICTDKTGTLTTNEIMVARLWLDGELLEVTGRGWQPQGRVEKQGLPLAPECLASPLWSRLLQAAVLCNNALYQPETAQAGGDPTEAALLVLAVKTGTDPAALRAAHPRLQVFPFEAVRKRMSVITSAPDGQSYCWVKGAPETLLPRCQQLLTREGQPRPLTSQDRAYLGQVLSELAQQGLRLLALAYKPVGSIPPDLEAAESNLILLGLTGMLDPPRPEVPAAIAACHQAGIRVIIVTGDHAGTAKAIAAAIGMRVRRGGVLTGEVLSRLSDPQLRRLLRRGGDLVFARTSPQDKLRLVTTLVQLGEIVAVTGDGVNDGPALKAADIGVAMGRRGTEVSREAANIVLTDDNFATIVAAIEEGRAVYANIRKFITYIFNSNIPEAVPFVLFVLFGLPLPLNIMQILAVDLGTDLLPALALGAEPPEPGIMSRPPRSRRDHLITWPVARRFTYLGLLNSLVALTCYFFVYYTAGWRPGLPLAASGPLYARATTMCLAGIIASQIGIALALRTEQQSVLQAGLARNRLLLGGIAMAILILIALSYLPPLQAVFGTAPLTFADWLFLLPWPAVLLGCEELRKAWQRRRRQPAVTASS